MSPSSSNSGGMLNNQSNQSDNPTFVPRQPPDGFAAQSALRSEINRALLHSGNIEKIHAHLQHLLQSSGWTDAVHNLCVASMRPEPLSSDRYGTASSTVVVERPASSYAEVLERVREKARRRVDERVKREGLVFIREAMGEVCEVG